MGGGVFPVEGTVFTQQDNLRPVPYSAPTFMVVVQFTVKIGESGPALTGI